MVMSQLKREISHTAEQLETLSNQYALLGADSHHHKQMLDSSNAQVAKLKSALSDANSCLESANEAKDNLQKQLEIAQQQLDSATSSLSYKVKSSCPYSLSSNDQSPFSQIMSHILLHGLNVVHFLGVHFNLMLTVTKCDGCVFYLDY